MQIAESIILLFLYLMNWLNRDLVNASFTQSYCTMGIRQSVETAEGQSLYYDYFPGEKKTIAVKYLCSLQLFKMFSKRHFSP